MKRVCLFFLAAFALCGQSHPYIDLAGLWKTIEADNPAFTRPGFDDRGWAEYRLPSPESDRQTEARWLRRSFAVEAGTKSDELVLTIGGFRSSYEVFVNGVKIGGTDGTIARATSYSVPAGLLRAGETNVIALRAPITVMVTGALRPLPNAGPFLITGRANAPVGAAAADRERHLRSATPVIAVALVNSVLALLLFLAWLANRREYMLGMMAGFLAAEALTRWLEYSYAFNGEQGRLGFAISHLATGLLVLAVLDQLGIDWRKAGTAGLLCFTALRVGNSWGILVLYGVLLCGLGRLGTQWKLLRGKRAILVALLLVLAMATTRFPSGLRLGTISAHVGGYYVRPWDVAVLLLMLVLVLLLLRRLMEDRREKQRLAAELEAARAVQQLLLPNAIQNSTRYESEAVYQPAQEVGGDFYWTRSDFNNALIVLVGDVSGKGLKAAMLVSVAVGILRNEKSASPAAILSALNEGLAGHTGGGFVTACCARFEANGWVTVANAGHPAPYGDGRELAVEAGLPLGVVTGTAYEESVVQGERFTFVSDGVVEAENAQRELFGFDRTREISTKSAREIAEAAKAWGQNDDITVVTVRRNA